MVMGRLSEDTCAALGSALLRARQSGHIAADALQIIRHPGDTARVPQGRRRQISSVRR